MAVTRVGWLRYGCDRESENLRFEISDSKESTWGRAARASSPRAAQPLCRRRAAVHAGRARFVGSATGGVRRGVAVVVGEVVPAAGNVGRPVVVFAVAHEPVPLVIRDEVAETRLGGRELFAVLFRVVARTGSASR